MDTFFLMADVLGFGNIVDNSTDDELGKRIGDWVNLVTHAKSQASISKTQLISDTVFAATDGSVDGARNLIRFAQILLNDGCRKSLPVRGAITYGSVEWTESLTYGKAVIKAHKLEAQQNWVGIACEPEMPYLDQLWGFATLICYPAPMKQGAIRLMPSVSWNVPDFADLQKLLMSGGLTRKGETIMWALGQKITNTTEFRMYCQRAQKNKGDPSKFYGTLPIQSIGS